MQKLKNYFNHKDFALFENNSGSFFIAQALSH